MIVARIASAAELVLKEYAKTKIVALLEKAIQVSANRGNVNDQQHSQAAEEIRREAQKIIDEGTLRLLPVDMANTLSLSNYATALPSSIARVLIGGVTNLKVTTMSSSELSVYLGQAAMVQNDLTHMLNAFKRLGFDPIKVPEGKISLDVLIPRDTADNAISYFLKVNSAFADIISCFEQLEQNPTEPSRRGFPDAAVI